MLIFKNFFVDHFFTQTITFLRKKNFLIRVDRRVIGVKELESEVPLLGPPGGRGADRGVMKPIDIEFSVKVFPGGISTWGIRIRGQCFGSHLAKFLIPQKHNFYEKELSESSDERYLYLQVGQTETKIISRSTYMISRDFTER